MFFLFYIHSLYSLYFFLINDGCSDTSTSGAIVVVLHSFVGVWVSLYVTLLRVYVKAYFISTSFV